VVPWARLQKESHILFYKYLKITNQAEKMRVKMFYPFWGKESPPLNTFGGNAN
jgi:hypothetical protein